MPTRTTIDRTLRRLRVLPPLPAQAPPRTQRVVEKLPELKSIRAFHRVARNLAGPQVVARHAESFDLTPAEVARLADLAGRARGFEVYGATIAAGGEHRAAVIAAVRQLTVSGYPHTARAFALGAVDRMDASLAVLAQGVVTAGLPEPEVAWRQLRRADRGDLLDLAPIEALSSAAISRAPELDEIVAGLLARAERYDATTLVELAGRLVSLHRREAARALADHARRRDPADLTERDHAALENLGQWLEPRAQEPTPSGAIRIGLLDYHQPDFDRSSRNAGDYVQTLAMLGNLARFSSVTFHGADGVGELASEIQAGIPAALRLESPAAEVHLRPLSRDFSSGDEVPEPVWAIGFGWHLHSTFQLGFGLPYHPQIRPIFLSFHLNRITALTDEAITHLRTYGPVGCRDQTTVDLLFSAGVDAFFTGCVTTTVDAAVPAVAPDAQRVLGVIDIAAEHRRQLKRTHEVVKHISDDVRSADLATGIRGARELLTGYRRRFDRILTSRLHSYLPATSLGIPVRFRPRIAGDVRFDGLLGFTPQAPEFTAMRDDLRELLADVHGWILAGLPEEEVYARWRERTASRVAAAKERLHAPADPVDDGQVDLAAVAARVRAGARRYGPDLETAAVTDIALSLDRALADMLPVTVDSVVRHATGPVRLWITTRGLDVDYETWFASCFPEVPITFVAMDDVEHGEVSRMIKHVSMATMDRLLLPEMLAELDRLIYLDIDTVCTADITELSHLDLAGAPLAARPGRELVASLWRQAGDLLEPEDASQLRRLMAARHPFGAVAFNAGVMVLDLAQMRADDFAAVYAPLAARYGLHDQDILNAYAGSTRADLPPRWNALVKLDEGEEGGVLHFAGGGKPWGDELVPCGEQWHAARRAFWQRVGGDRSPI